MAAQPATPPAEQAIRSSRDLQSLQEAVLAPVTTIKQFLHVVPASVLPELQQQLRDAVSDASVLSELVREQQRLTGLDPFSDTATKACSPLLLQGEAASSTGNVMVETYTEISDPDAHRSLDDNTRKQLMAVVAGLAFLNQCSCQAVRSLFRDLRNGLRTAAAAAAKAASKAAAKDNSAAQGGGGAAGAAVAYPGSSHTHKQQQALAGHERQYGRAQPFSNGLMHSYGSQLRERLARTVDPDTGAITRLVRLLSGWLEVAVQEQQTSFLVQALQVLAHINVSTGLLSGNSLQQQVVDLERLRSPAVAAAAAAVSKVWAPFAIAGPGSSSQTFGPGEVIQLGGAARAVTAGYKRRLSSAVKRKVEELQLTEVNGLAGRVDDPSFITGILQLHHCGLVNLSLHSNALSGSLTDEWGQMSHLEALDLTNNLIQGTMPNALRNLTGLRKLALNSNLMHGTVPHWLGELQSLVILNLAGLQGVNPDGRVGLVGSLPDSLASLSRLTALVMSFNSLTGTVPSGMCHAALHALSLAGNRLTGACVEKLLNCSNLMVLDMYDNQCSGTFPDLLEYSWNQLIMMDLSSNVLQGSLPPAFFKLSTVQHLTLANNRLTGSISSSISSMSSLSELYLADNQLSGSIDEGLWYAPQLTDVDLSYNQLTGTISPACRVSSHLRSLNLAGNRLTGTIPPQLAISRSLSSVDLSHNSLGCSLGTDTKASNDQGQQCVPTQLLPCFLAVSNETYHVPDDRGMQCPRIVRKEYGKAVEDCQGSGPSQLGGQATTLPNSQQLINQTWTLDQSYLRYTNCKCLPGYTEEWTASGAVLTCIESSEAVVPTKSREPSWAKPIAAGVSSASFTAMVGIALVVRLKMTGQLRRKWQREKELDKNRQRGVPTEGLISIVVTDVEGYSELMQQDAVMCAKAMGIHNAVLRKVVTAHAGHVIEQEGDSWAVAFHRPVDAVAFCLQVQQALHKSSWPAAEALGTAQEDLASDSRVVSLRSDTLPARMSISDLHRATTRRHSVDSSPQLSHGISRMQRSSQVSTASAVTTGNEEQHGKHNKTMLEFLRHSFSNKTYPVGGPDSSEAGSPTAVGSHKSLADTQSGSGSMFLEAWVTTSLSTRKGPWAHNLVRHDSREPLPATGALKLTAVDQEITTATVSGDVNGAGSTGVCSKSALPASKVQKSAARLTPLRGLRVRMGVATGWLPSSSDITTCALFELAKGVSDVANGGQVLLESNTFSAVQDWLAELGTIDHKGYNDKLIMIPHAMQPGNTGSGFVWWVAHWLGKTSVDAELLLLDMGHFWMANLCNAAAVVANGSSLGTRMRSHAGGHDRSTASGHSRSHSHGGGGACIMDLQPGENAAVIAAAGAVTRGTNDASTNSCIQLYSILPHASSARCQVWKGALNLGERSQQLSKGYFDAPGTDAVASYSPFTLEPGRLLLPPVTMVFAAVEGGKDLVRRKEHVAQHVHCALRWMMQVLLLALPDGYLCREQEGVLKYMLAFRSPGQAAQWCLLLQEVLQHVPWPAEVQEAFRSSRHSIRSGSFRRMSFKHSARPAIQQQAESCALGADGGNDNLHSMLQSSCGRRPQLQLKLNMGLAEGVPEKLTPDFLGRADYLGMSVNLAARMMAAAAQGGQIVLSSSTAEAVFSSWRIAAELRTAQQQSGANHHTPHTSTTGGDVLRGMMPAPLTAHGQETIAPGPTRTPAAVPSSSEGGAVWSMLIPPGDGEATVTATTADSPRAGCSSIVTSISAQHVGLFQFKGCGEVDVVRLTADHWPAAQEAQAAQAAGPPGAHASMVGRGEVKGKLLVGYSGPVLGLQGCPVTMPNILSELQRAWSKLLS
eukprot:gene4431-4686_t